MSKPPRTAGDEAADAATAEMRARARAAGGDLIAALLELTGDSTTAPVKLAAIKELLDRGFGRPAAAPGENGGRTVIVHLVIDDGYAD